MTVRDAMMHMTGLGWGGRRTPFATATSPLTEGATGGMAAALANPLDADWTLETLMERLAERPLRFHPGTHWFYSVSTDVCARLVEIISGQRFDEYLNEEIFEPLGMVDTGFMVPDEKIDRFSANYGRARDKSLRLLEDPLESSYRKLRTFLSGGGGLVSTSADYLRFAQMMCNGGELDGTRILSRKTMELMTLNHLPGGGQLRDFAEPGGYGEVGFDGVGFGLTMAVGLGPVANQTIGTRGRVHVGRRRVDDLLGRPGRRAGRDLHDAAHAFRHVQLPRTAEDARVRRHRRLRTTVATGSAARVGLGRRLRARVRPVDRRVGTVVHQRPHVRSGDRIGVWHLIGITHAEPMAAHDEKHLAHATAPALHGPWTKRPFALSADLDAGETHLWAPHVVVHDDRYWMFYCGGGLDETAYRIRLAVSDDCWRWTRHAANPLVVDGFHHARSDGLAGRRSLGPLLHGDHGAERRAVRREGRRVGRPPHVGRAAHRVRRMHARERSAGRRSRRSSSPATAATSCSSAPTGA